MVYASDYTALRPTVLNLPTGPGSVTGLGESFTPELNTGTSSYHVPLILPQGRAGLTPGLSINYNSGFGSSLLGLSFKLSIPYIQRQTDKGLPNYSEYPQGDGLDNDFNGDVDEYSELDTFVDQDGNELVQTTATTFRKKFEGSFETYHRLSTGWKVVKPNGIQFYFGISNQSQVINHDQAFRWHLEKIQDRHGNQIHYTYTRDEDSAQVYPAQISYNKDMSVSFEYEDRTDILTDYRPGFEVKTTKRIAHIRTHLADKVLRDYQFSYQPTDQWHPHSMLSSITERSGDGQLSRPPLAFTYTSATPESFEKKQLPELKNIKFGLNGTDFIDMNQDGLADVLNSSKSWSYYWINLGPDEHGLPQYAEKKRMDTKVGDLVTASNTHWVDIDGDGRTEMVQEYSRKIKTYELEDNHWKPAPDLKRAAVSIGGSASRFMDVNNDKRIDAFFSAYGKYYVSLNLENGWSKRIQLDVRDERMRRMSLGKNTTKLADMNGDGLVDVISAAGKKVRYFPNMGMNGFGKKVEYENYFPQMKNGRYATFTDINGDGRADMLLKHSNHVTVWINLGLDTSSHNKAHFSDPIKLERARGKISSVRFMDMNGNGSTDIFWYDLYRGVSFIDFYPKEQPFQLKTINNGLGQTIRLNYETLAREMKRDEADGKPWDSGVPIGMQVLKSFSYEDAITGQSQTTTIDYHNGYYHGEDKAFRGFAASEQTELGDASQPTLLTAFQYFVGRDEEVLKGKTKSVETKDAKGQIFWKETNTWTVKTLVEGYEDESRDVKFAALMGKERLITEQGRGTPVTLAWDYDYDKFGNLIYTHEHGRKSGQWQDERITRVRYSASYPAGQDNWLLHLPVEKTVADGLGKIHLKQQWFYDDESFSGTNLGELSEGLLTASKVWTFPEDDNSAIFAERHRYDTHGNVIANFGPLWGKQPGHAVHITYDDQYQTFPVKESIETGKTTLTAQATYDVGLGVIQHFTDFNGHQTTFGYDGLARLTSIVRPGDTAQAPTVTYAYHLATEENGKAVNWIETQQRETKGGGTLDSRTYFDGAGQALMSQTEGEKEGQVVVSGYQQRNARGQVVQTYHPFFAQGFGFEKTPSSVFQHMTYDALGRVQKTTHPDGTFAQITHEPLVQLLEDEAQTDPSSARGGAQKRLTFDGLLDDKGQGRLRHVDEIVAVDQNGEIGMVTEWRTAYEYDVLGHFTRLTDAQQNVRTMQYDALGRNYFYNDPNRGKVYRHYDEANNLVAQRDARGKVIYFDYDGVNRVTAKYWAEEKTDDTTINNHIWTPKFSKGTPVVSYQYDQGEAGRNLLGQIARIEDQVGFEAFGFDTRGRQVLQERHIQGPDIAAKTYATHLSYDAADRLTNYQYPDGTSLSYVYNLRGLLSHIPGVVDSLTYSPAGTLDTRTLANGITTQYRYDNRLRLSGLQSTRGKDGLTIQDLSYAYDPVSNIEAINDNRSKVALTAIGKELGLKGSQSNQLKQSFRYQYDDLYRLIEAKGLNTYQFRYDPIGNMLAKTVNNPLTGTQQQLLRYGNSADHTNQGSWHRQGREGEDSAGPHALTYAGHALSYDPSGNRLTDDDQLYTWDHDQRLARVDSAQGKTEFGYDARHQRRYKINTPKTGMPSQVVYINDLVELRDGTLYKYVTFGNDKIARSGQSGGAFQPTALYLNQHLGSTALTTNAQGEVLNAFTYSPFGELDKEFGQTGLAPYQFTGKETDKETGLGYFSHRYLNHKQGQFLTPDPVFALPERFTDPQQWTPYAYARNNPVRYIDPTGQYNEERMLKRSRALQRVTFDLVEIAAKKAKIKLPKGLADYLKTQKLLREVNDAIERGDLKAVRRIVDAYNKDKVSKSSKQTNSPTFCFQKGTLVDTPLGTIAIEELKAGDQVFAFDIDNGKKVIEEVVQTHRGRTKTWIKIDIGNDELIATPEHPFWDSLHNHWVKAEDITPSTILLLKGAQKVPVKGVEKVTLIQYEETYNITVSKQHNYFVGNSGVLTHNQKQTPTQLPDKVIYNKNGIRIWHNFGNVNPSPGTRVEHAPIHFHSSYKGKEYKSFASGAALRDSKGLPKEIQKAFSENRSKFRSIEKRIGKWYRSLPKSCG